MKKLTFTSIGKILDARTKRKLLGLSIARVAANLLDLVGLAGIALLATSFSSLASGTASRAPLRLPGFGEILITEVQAVFIALAVALVFLAKSGFSIWLNLLTSLTVAKLETHFSTQLARDFFSGSDKDGKRAPQAVADFQNQILYSTNALSIFLNGRLTFIAEFSLLAVMTVVFLVVNPVATIAMFTFMGLVLYVMNKMIGFRIVRNGEMQMSGYEKTLITSRDLFNVKREAMTAGVTHRWLDRFSAGRAEAARGHALNYTLNTLPRYVVETSLVLGIFAFVAGVVIFSDLPSQAVTIGVFMAGGLRLVASLLPLQAATNQMKDGSNRGTPAFNAILENSGIRTSAYMEPPKSREITGQIEFGSVSYRYPGSDRLVLDTVSFEIAPLTKVAIVGPSGAGKSTLFDLATGFREPLTGSISIGGASPRDILLAAPGTFGIVTQRPHLVSGSILENTSLVDGLLSDKTKVLDALVRAGLGHLTESPDWFKLEIRPDSGQLSGGEIQRLGLARALYRDPKILFLDEATSALDAETEAEITKVLQSLKGEMTVVLIAHRLSTVMHADKIIYLDRGRVVAEGTFSELKEKVPGFAKAVELMDLGKAN